jgi:TusE/DsrC/DsvC family sulfur relay protein
MSDVMVAGRTIHVNEEGFMTDPTEWDEEIGEILASNIGIELTDAHWAAVKFARDDQASQGVTPTLRRLAQVGGVPTKEMFALFPKKPAKKLAYVAGLPKPVGCV